MPSYAPIDLSAVDDSGKVLFQYSIPFEFGLSAKQLLERAFVIAQTSSGADRFLYTVEFYGYGQSKTFPGYLGYEIESIAGLKNTPTLYWDLILDSVSSSSGADTTYPKPGGTVLWKYSSIPTDAAKSTARSFAVQNRLG